VSRGRRGRRARAPASPWHRARLARKGEPPLHGEDAGVAELLHVLDSRHALQHLLVAELFQGLEVEVPKVGLTQPPTTLDKYPR
jgi:hypothetical protein